MTCRTNHKIKTKQESEINHIEYQPCDIPRAMSLRFVLNALVGHHKPSAKNVSLDSNDRLESEMEPVLADCFQDKSTGQRMRREGLARTLSVCHRYLAEDLRQWISYYWSEVNDHGSSWDHCTRELFPRQKALQKERQLSPSDNIILWRKSKL